MNKVLVIGASGQIGQRLLSILSSKHIPTIAMVRNAKKLPTPNSNIEVIEADLEGEFSHAMQGCSTVVFTAGSGPTTGLDKTFLVDLWGAAKAIDTAKAHNIKHFIMVSSRGAGNPDNGPVAIKPYCIAKHFADEHLVRSGLNYTILRPGRLTDAPIKSTISTTRPAAPEAQFISREITAQAIAHCINNRAVDGKIFELYEGEKTLSELLA